MNNPVVNAGKFPNRTRDHPKRDKTPNQPIVSSQPITNMTTNSPNSKGQNSRENRRNRKQKKQQVREQKTSSILEPEEEDNFDYSQFNMAYSSKKNTKSLNHLLNFHYSDPHNAPSSDSYKSSNRKNREGFHRFNKETFLQANFRFVISPSEDSDQYLYNPDAVVSWDNIVQVYVSTNETLSCPICLDRPSVPKITKCGHIYCWPCMLHYMSDVKRGWKRCPICFESVTRASLKSVIVENSIMYSCNGMIQMVLMKRPKESTLAIPCSMWSKLSPTRLPSNLEQSFKYSRVSIARDPARVVQQEIDQLQIALSSTVSSGETEESEFILEALTYSKEELAKLPKIRVIHAPSKDQLLSSTTSSNTEKSEDQQFVSMWDEEQEPLPVSSSTTSTTTVSSGPPTLQLESPSILQSSASTDDCYYFYQASDTQKLFLHPFTMKCLLTEFGNYENLPLSLNSKIISMDEVTLTENLRKRYRFLSHLPLTTQLHFLELDVDSLLSNETLRLFSEEKKKRERLKNQRENEAKRQNQQNNYKNEPSQYVNDWGEDFSSPEPLLPLSEWPTAQSVGSNKEEFPIWPAREKKDEKDEAKELSEAETKLPTESPPSRNISYLSAATSPPPPEKLDISNLPVQKKKGKKYVVLSLTSHHSFK